MKAAAIYEIRVEGHIPPEHWSEWFEGLVICNEPEGQATLTGKVEDPSALMGILNRILALNISLISVKRI